MIFPEELAKKREDIQQELLVVEERLQRELEKSLEEKPKHGPSGNGDREVDRNNTSFDDDVHSDNGQAEVDDRMVDEEEEEEQGSWGTLLKYKATMT